MWRPINFTLHAMWFAAFLVLAKDYHFVDPTLYDAVLAANEREVFSLAVQLGRLDFLNSVLAILALVIAGGAIFGILEVRKGAEVKAEAAAKVVAEGISAKVAEKEVERILPSVVRRMVEEAEEERAKLGTTDTNEPRLQKMMNALDKGGDQR